MPKPKVTRFELELLEQLWKLGTASVREIQEALPDRHRLAYTTVQTVVYRLMEGKKAVRIVRKIGNAHIFEPAITRDDAGRRLFDDLRALFGGRTKPVMAHLVKTGQVTLADIQEAERVLREHQEERKRK